MIKQGKDVFVLVYMEGCGPCNATRPEWAKIESALKDQYAKNDKLVVVDVNKDFMSNIKHIGKVDGFPTMKYIDETGKETTTSGAKQSGDEILTELQVPKASSTGGRHRPRGRRTHRLSRKLRHRTLRNYVSLRK
jgi:thiol-disulfide isomerase/thioredoxin